MAPHGLNDVGDLYRRVAPTIYRRCLRLLGAPEAARDATQEVFVRVIEHAGQLRDDRGYLPWIYRVATNHCLDLLRQRVRHEAAGSDLVVAPTGLDPEGVVHLRQVLTLLERGIDERSLQIAVYAFVDGMTQDEIATVMGLSRRTVGKKLSRIRESALEFRAMVTR